MRASVAKIEKNRVQLEIEVDAPELDKALEQAYRKLVKKYTVPGFRKGKTPRRLLENYLGKAPFYDEALDLVVPEAYKDAVEETKIEPIDKPDVELVQLEEGQPLIFKVTVDVKPEVELGEYKGLELTAKEVNITEQDINNYLETLQKRTARLVAVEDGVVQEGDTVQIDFEGFIDGEAFPGGKGENFSLEIGSGTFIPGFEEQLVGAHVDEERELHVTFPSEYHQENLAGKEATFKVKVLGIKRKEFSPIDDEFAKDVSEFETLEELRQDVENKLKETAQESRKRALKNQATTKATENASVEVPLVMVDRRIDSMVRGLEQRLVSQGVDFEKYLEYTGATVETTRDNFRAQAEFDVKSELVLEAIAKAEGLTVEQEEIDREIERMARAYGQKPEVMQGLMNAQGGTESLKYDMLLNKAVEFLVANAVVTEPAEPVSAEQDDVQEMAAENQ